MPSDEVIIYFTISIFVISRLFQKWCSSGAVNALPYRRVIDFTGFSRTFQDTAVTYNEEEIHQRLDELDEIINAKFDELCSGNGNADKLNEEIYTAAQEQLELETMLANLQNQAYYNKTYGTYGLEYQLPANELYYDGKLVKYFVDNQSVSASSFNGNLWENPNGEISVEAVRNGSGELSGLKEMPEKDIKALNATHSSSINGNEYTHYSSFERMKDL